MGLGLANDVDTELELSMANIERVPYCDDAAEGIQDGVVKWGALALAKKSKLYQTTRPANSNSRKQSTKPINLK